MDDIERLRRVFDEGPLGVAVLDATYRLIDVNSRFCDMLGYTRDELLALTFPEFTHPDDISKDVSLAAKLFRGEIPRYEIEERFVRKDGEVIWVRLHASVLHNDNGEPEFALGMVEDITAQRRERSAQDRTRQLLEGVVANSPVVLFAIDAEGRFTLSEGQGLAALGLKPGEVVGQSAYDVYRDAPEIERNIRRALTGDAFSSTVEVDGLFFDTWHNPVRDGNGMITGFIGISIDVTERELAMKARRASEERFRRLSEGAIEGTAISEQGIILDANPQLARLFGYELSEIVGEPVSSLVAPESRELVSKRIAAGSDRPYEHMAIRKDGTIFPVQAHGKAIEYEGRTVRVTNIRDITERKQVDDALKESEEQFRSLTELSPAAILVFQDEKVVFANAEMVEGSEYSASELCELNFVDLMPPEERDPAKRRLAACLDGSEPRQTMRHRTVTKSGIEGWAETMMGRVQFQGRPAVIAVATDVTEQMRTEQALRKTQERLVHLADTAPAAVTVIQGTAIRYANAAFETMTGYSAQELSRVEASEIVHPDDREAFFDRMAKRLADDESPDPVRFRLIRKDGKERWAETSATLIDFEEEPAVFAITFDVTERVNAEEELQKSEVRFRELAETAQAGIFIVSGITIVYANAAGERLTGRSLEELQTIDFWETAHPEDREALVEHFDGPESAGQLSSPYVYRVLKPNGEERWVEASAAMTSFQGENAGAVILLDVTDRVRAEEAKQQTRDELEGKVERQMLRKNPYELTFRELTVLHHVAAGEADKEIAAELGISPLTVQNHVSHILRKMDASSRTDAGVRAVRAGLVD